MALELISSQNELCWGETKVYNKKPPNSTPISNIFSNPNPNARKHHHHPSFLPRQHDDQAAKSSAAAASDNSSAAFAWRSGATRDAGGFITFDVSTYSKKELRELKRRLESELEQVRRVSSRIESKPVLEPPPPPPPPRAPENLVGNEGKVLGEMMSRCKQILAKLMKHKGGGWFNSPVDVANMGLHDYHQIVKRPMDLGTVKSKLNDSVYRSPLDVADDIRLTFNNALLYNPQGHEVHKFADQLLRIFEANFSPALLKYNKKLADIASRRASHPEPPIPIPIPIPNHPKIHHHHQQQQQQQKPLIGKQLKQPKAKGPNKRPMSFEKKKKLSEDLESLPMESMEQVLQIVRRMNVNTVVQDGDEIELDFESMDVETLWELDRFVCNWKKITTTSKATTTNPIPAPTPLPQMGCDELVPVSKRMKKGVPLVEEDVDIGEDFPSTNYPSVEIEKDVVGHASSSSSSSTSGATSSSGSDSDSSSSGGSDSGDGDDAATSHPTPRN